MIKWLAPECLGRGRFGTGSDVWAYGVTAWEIVHYAATPYPRMTCAQVAAGVCKGYVMAQPFFVSRTLYELVLQCWRPEASARPSFAGLRAAVEGLLPQAAQHIKLDADGIKAILGEVWEESEGAYASTQLLEPMYELPVPGADSHNYQELFTSNEFKPCSQVLGDYDVGQDQYQPLYASGASESFSAVGSSRKAPRAAEPAYALAATEEGHYQPTYALGAESAYTGITAASMSDYQMLSPEYTFADQPLTQETRMGVAGEAVYQQASDTGLEDDVMYDKADNLYAAQKGKNGGVAKAVGGMPSEGLYAGLSLPGAAAPASAVAGVGKSGRSTRSKDTEESLYADAPILMPNKAYVPVAFGKESTYNNMDELGELQYAPPSAAGYISVQPD